MIKKTLALSLFVLLGLFAFLIPSNVYAAENEDEQAQEVVTYPCKVLTSVNSGGDILVDIEEGNVGDIVTAYIKADFLFAVSSIKFNDVEVEINKDGKYEFELVEGDNVISVEFKVNNEKLSEIATLINGVKEEGFASLFTVANLLNLISWIVSVFLSSGFFITLIKSKRLKAKTVDEVVDVVKTTIQAENQKAILDFLQGAIVPILNKLIEKIDGSDECMKVLCRCFVLAQNDTPENRLAIITELTNLNNSDEALSNQIRQIVKDEQAKQIAELEERNKKLEALKEANENIVIENNSGDSYGQL